MLCYGQAVAQIDQSQEIAKNEMEGRIELISEREYTKIRTESDKAYQTNRNSRYKEHDKIREKAEE